jgi:diacylglycerol diphosphate phosphatase/phosphatidate phosphatase
VLSYFSYRQYYPSLASPFSHRPYSPRIPRYEQDSAGIPSPDATPAQTEPAGESIELAGTVKRGGENLTEIWKGGKETPAPQRAQNQMEAIANGDASQNV